MLYSLAITITLYTPVPPSVSSSAPFALFHPCSGLLVLRAATFRLSSSPSVSSSLCLVSSLRFLSLPCSPVPRSSCRADRGYSAIVFDLSCSCCDCNSPGDSACLPLPRVLYRNLSFSFFFAFLSLLFSSLSGAAQLASISQPAAPTSRLSSFLSSSSSFSFIREMGDEIYEVKLMITTSKQRTERLRVEPSHSLPSFYITSTFLLTDSNNSSIYFFRF